MLKTYKLLKNKFHLGLYCLYESLAIRISYFWRLSHFAKSVRIRNFSGPYFPAFGLNTEIYSVSRYSQNRKVTVQTPQDAQPGLGTHWPSIQNRYSVVINFALVRLSPRGWRNFSRGSAKLQLKKIIFRLALSLSKIRNMGTSLLK